MVEAIVDFLGTYSGTIVAICSALAACVATEVTPSMYLDLGSLGDASRSLDGFLRELLCLVSCSLSFTMATITRSGLKI